MKIFLVGLATVLFMVSITGVAGAIPITGGTTGLSSPDVIVTFDELGNLQDQVITSQFSAFGVTFENFGWDNATHGQAGSTGFSGGDLVNGFAPFPTADPAIVSFTEDVNSAVFAAIDQDSTWDISAWLDGALVESFNITIPSAPGLGYIGFSGITFDSIELASTSAITIDNLQYTRAAAPVPEPSTMLLLGSGLVGLIGYNYRRGKQSV